MLHLLPFLRLHWHLLLLLPLCGVMLLLQRLMLQMLW